MAKVTMGEIVVGVDLKKEQKPTKPTSYINNKDLEELKKEMLIHRDLISKCADKIKLINDSQKKDKNLKLETEMKQLKAKITRETSITDEKIEAVESKLIEVESKVTNQPKVIKATQGTREIIKHVDEVNTFNVKRLNKLEEDLRKKLKNQRLINTLLVSLLVLTFLI